jgi:hypothetical protein
MSGNIERASHHLTEFQELPTKIGTRSLTEDIGVQEFVAEFTLWIELFG